MSRECVEVASGVFVMTSARYTTTTTIVTSGSATMLVDPAWSLTELEGVRTWLVDTGHVVTAGFATHAHHDHLLWHPDFGDAPRWASAGTVAAAAAWRDELEAALDDDYRAIVDDPFGPIGAVVSDTVPDPFGDGDGDGDGEPIELIVHAGHAPGHTALWLPGRRTFVAGDMLSDVELPLPFNPDDLAAYLDALDAMAPFVAQATMLIPGHGHPTDRPLGRLDADRRYLDAVLRGEDPDDGRRALPGMDEAHTRIVELARTMRTDG
jgi:glyoxylase-like metal-dependent hydrolase (beta-lactamase superfamily II)